MNSLPGGDNRDYYFDKRENVKGSVATEHYHAAFELYYMRDGECSYFIGDKLYDVVAGDVVLIPAGIIHRTNYGTKPHTRFLLNFKEDFISPEIYAATLALGYLYSNKALVDKIRAVFAMIEDEYLRNDALSSAALKAYTEQLLIAMIRSENEKKRESGGNMIVEKTVQYIQENYMNDVKLSTVARLVNVSAEHLSRIFKRETGFGFSEYLTLYRLQRAEYMLYNEPGRTVGEIAYTCGFNDSNYFSYRFKQRYGVAPTEAREGIEAEARFEK